MLKNETMPRWQDQFTHTRDLGVQITLSVALGLSALIAFCILRPRWTELYNARKKQSSAASRLPDLPETMFGWIPVLYRISEMEVLASAGLDAYVVSDPWPLQAQPAAAEDGHSMLGCLELSPTFPLLTVCSSSPSSPMRSNTSASRCSSHSLSYSRSTTHIPVNLDGPLQCHRTQQTGLISHLWRKRRS